MSTAPPTCLYLLPPYHHPHSAGPYMPPEIPLGYYCLSLPPETYAQDRRDLVCPDEHCPPSTRGVPGKGGGCSRLGFAEGTSGCSALASRPQLEVTKASPFSRARNLPRLRLTASPVWAAGMSVHVRGRVSAVRRGGEEQKPTRCRAASAQSGPDAARCPVPTDTPLWPWSSLVL